MTENRTLQFMGYAYGNAPVLLNAHINGTIVFSGEVPTLDTPFPPQPQDMSPGPALFSVENSPLFSTDFSGSYPMTISVATGNGILLQNVNCNYMSTSQTVTEAVIDNSTITGNVLTVGTLISGTLAVGQWLTGNGVALGTAIKNSSGSDWIVNVHQTVEATTITASADEQISGNATAFFDCYFDPTTGEGDPRSNIIIDGVEQPHPIPPTGTYTWQVWPGSTISCDLNVSLGNVA